MTGGKIDGNRISRTRRLKEEHSPPSCKQASPAYLLTDLIEEDFRHEIVPHLTGGAHRNC